MRFRFTLSHDVLGSVEIDPPDGWKNSDIILERHEQFYSLIERYEGSAEGAFIFYGNDGQVNGGIDFIKQVEQTYGFNAIIEFTAEYSYDDVTFEEVFTGKLALHLKNEMTDNRMQVPVIPDDFWTTFINRMELPVDFSSATDVDGNAVSASTPISVNLTPQVVRQTYQADYTEEQPDIFGAGNHQYTIAGGQYGIVSFGHVILDEIEKVYNYVNIDDPALPFEMFDVEYAGTYRFQFNLNISTTATAVLGSSVPGIGMRFQINDDAAISVSSTNIGTPGVDESGRFSFDQTHTLKAHDLVRIYFINTTGSPITFYAFSGNTQASGTKNITVTADTIFPESQAQGYLIHDAINHTLARIGLGHTSPLYSDFLGSTTTNTRTYPDDGCGWVYAIFKGLQFRDYTLTEKPFFTSFKQLWDGINPILNLGLSYEESGSSPGGKIIRIEPKIEYFDETPSISFSNVRSITASYDQKHLFKSVRIGYKKWQSEDKSGIDDPQTKHTYGTILKQGTDLVLESDFIAAGLAIETTRRKSRKKTQDYKFDDDTFVIALKENDVSPDVYAPELGENFNSVTGVLNADTRYNLILTPMRNLLRWANLLGGCLQMYTTSSYKFQSGEGNYDMVSDYSCSGGNMCQAILCDALGESQDIPLGPPTNYNTAFGYLFYPMQYDIIIPMEWDDFNVIRANPKKAIGISQTESDHQPFFIKKIKYNIMKAEAVIEAWPREYFNIQVIQGEYNAPGCPIERTISSSDDDSVIIDFDEDYQAILDYAESQNLQLPSDAQQLIQNSFVVDLKNRGIWDGLDLLYVFATNGDRDFAKINWKNPGTNNATEIDSLTFIADAGFAGNGTSSYLDTGWAPNPDAVNFSQDEGGAFIHINTDRAGGTIAEFGCRGNGGGATNGDTNLRAKGLTGLANWGVNGNGVGVSAGGSTVGFHHLRRTSSTALDYYKNGVSFATSSQASTTLSTRDMVICAQSFDGVVASFSTCQITVFGIGASLQGKESQLYEAWNDYFTAL
jgi:hypothetical protein